MHWPGANHPPSPVLHPRWFRGAEKKAPECTPCPCGHSWSGAPLQPFLCALIRPHLISALASPDFRFSLAILLLMGSLQRDTRTWLSSCPYGMDEGVGLSLFISAASLFAPLSFLLSRVRGACGPVGCWGEWHPSSVGQLPSEVCPVSCLLVNFFKSYVSIGSSSAFVLPVVL